MKINDKEISLSANASERLADLLCDEFHEVQEKIHGETSWSKVVGLAHSLVALDAAVASLYGNLLDDLDNYLDQRGTLQVECKADDAGRLKTPMSDEVLLDCLVPTLNIHPATRLSIADANDPTLVKELGLYTVAISLGGNTITRKVWIVPTQND